MEFKSLNYLVLLTIACLQWVNKVLLIFKISVAQKGDFTVVAEINIYLWWNTELKRGSTFSIDLQLPQNPQKSKYIEKWQFCKQKINLW